MAVQHSLVEGLLNDPGTPALLAAWLRSEIRLAGGDPGDDLSALNRLATQALRAEKHEAEARDPQGEPDWEEHG